MYSADLTFEGGGVQTDRMQTDRMQTERMQTDAECRQRMQTER